MRFKDIPQDEQPMPENEVNRIMHIALPIPGGAMLMGSDISEGMGMKLQVGNTR